MEGTVNDVFYVAGTWPIDESKPTIIFIHGSGGSHVLWDKQVEALLPHANTIALDLPGHGRSQGEGKDNIKDYSRVVHQFIESLNLSHPIPCGLSIGGAIALQLLIDKKSAYTGGILINTGARLKVLPMIFESIKTDYHAHIEATKQFAISEKTDSGKIELLVEAMRQCKIESTLKDFQACDAFDVMGTLHVIDVSVLVITAEDDKLTPPKYGTYLAENIPGSSTAHIHAAGHFSPLEKEKEVNQAILDFLKHLD